MPTRNQHPDFLRDRMGFTILLKSSNATGKPKCGEAFQARQLEAESPSNQTPIPFCLKELSCGLVLQEAEFLQLKERGGLGQDWREKLIHL